jgi:hypothetical protein
MQDVYQPRGEFKNSKVAFCIHNIAFQGRFWTDTFNDMNLPKSAMDKLGFKDGNPVVYTEKDPLNDDDKPKAQAGSFDKLNWMKVCKGFCRCLLFSRYKMGIGLGQAHCAQCMLYTAMLFQ